MLKLVMSGLLLWVVSGWTQGVVMSLMGGLVLSYWVYGKMYEVFSFTQFYDSFGLVMGVMSIFLIWLTRFLGAELLLGALLLMVMGCFTSQLGVSFYIFFELSLIPLFLVILIYGGTPERLKASWGLFVYTLAGSLPLFMQIMSFSLWGASPYFISWVSGPFISGSVGFFWLIAFFVKIPIMGLHSWLPVAHGEAPTFGSMVLGAVMLKLGVIGLYRVYSFGKKIGLDKSSDSIVVWAVSSFFLSAILAISSKDMKTMIAYSSVVHMAPVIFSLMIGGGEGLQGAILVSVGHGLASSLLFLGIGMIYKNRGLRGSYGVKSGGMSLLFSFFWFLSCILNAAIPPSMNYFGEVFMFFSLFSFSLSIMSFCVMPLVLSGMYCIFLYTTISHKSMSSLMKKYSGLDQKGLIMFKTHWGFVLLFSVYSGLL